MNTSFPKISIIMPVKDALPFLKECLESICNQSYIYWELLAVDDHSLDGSAELLKTYAASEPRIHNLRNPGKGIIEALRTGYKNSTGDFITRMDADDIMPEIKLDALLQPLLQLGRKKVTTGYVKYISENTLGAGYLAYEGWLNGLCDTNRHYQEIYRECVIPSPCWMMHREDFEAIGGFENDIYPEDYDLCFRMYTNQIEVVPICKILHLWRDHPTRTSRTDDNYQDNRFLDLKLHYFLSDEVSSDIDIILWGAGRKGKIIAKCIIENGLDFKWVTNNSNKIGKDIYGKILLRFQPEYAHKETIFVVAVANKEEQNDISKALEISMIEKYKIYFFC